MEKIIEELKSACDGLEKEPSNYRIAVVRTSLKHMLDLLHEEVKERAKKTLPHIPQKPGETFEIHAPKPADTVKP